jgi:hypothetical protein
MENERRGGIVRAAQRVSFILRNGKRECHDVDYDRYIGLSPLFLFFGFTKNPH